MRGCRVRVLVGATIPRRMGVAPAGDSAGAQKPSSFRLRADDKLQRTLFKSLRAWLISPDCGRGGIGIHNRLKICRSQDHAGSSPAVRTSFADDSTNGCVTRRGHGSFRPTYRYFPAVCSLFVHFRVMLAESSTAARRNTASGPLGPVFQVQADRAQRVHFGLPLLGIRYPVPLGAWGCFTTLCF